VLPSASHTWVSVGPRPRPRTTPSKSPNHH
jgi:hypothetical protein